jgi:hypothetical protein
VIQNELLQLALEQGLTRDQVISALSALIENNERYLARRRRHGYQTEIDAFLERTQPALALAVELLQGEASSL